MVSQTTLLVIRNLFAADSGLQSVAFNGHVRSINPATGDHEYPCLLSVETTRDAFPPDEKLRAVTPDVCLRRLGAVVSPHPYEVEPVEPILDFDLSRFRFVDGLDAVSTLDARPDLMQMSPTNFEHLVRQLFVVQGAERRRRRGRRHRPSHAAVRRPLHRAGEAVRLDEPDRPEPPA